MLGGVSDVFQGAPGEYRPLGDLAADSKHLGEHTGQIDRNFPPQRFKPQVEPLDVERPPTVGDLPISEQGADDLDTLPQARYGIGKGEAMLGFHLYLVARAQTQDEAAAREVVHGGGRHRYSGRAPYEDAADAGPQKDGLGGQSASRQDRELVATMSLRHPGRFVAKLLGQLHTLDYLRRGHASRESHTDAFHVTDLRPTARLSGGGHRR